MKQWTLRILIVFFTLATVGCGGASKAKRGCPTSDSNLGAERVLAGEGNKKPSKFKVKGMDKTYR